MQGEKKPRTPSLTLLAGGGEADLAEAKALLQDPHKIAPVDAQAFGKRLAETITQARRERFKAMGRSFWTH
jgi:hypothetical protein